MKPPKPNDSREELQTIVEDVALRGGAGLAQSLREGYPGEKGRLLAEKVGSSSRAASAAFEPLRRRLEVLGIHVPSIAALRLLPGATQVAYPLLLEVLDEPLSEDLLTEVVSILSDPRVAPPKARLGVAHSAIGILRSARSLTAPLEERLGEAIRRSASRLPIAPLVEIVAYGERTRAIPPILAGMATFREARMLKLLESHLLVNRPEVLALVTRNVRQRRKDSC